MDNNELIKELKSIHDWIDPPFPREVVNGDIEGCKSNIINLIKRLRKERREALKIYKWITTN